MPQQSKSKYSRTSELRTPELRTDRSTERLNRNINMVLIVTELQLQLLAYYAMASSSASTSSKVATKRKRNTLSIETKLQILKKIEKGSSLSSLAAEYGTGKSTIFDIKRSREKIMKFATKAVDETSLKKRCIVRRADDSTFDKAIHLWFLQERHKGTPVLYKYHDEIIII